MTRPKRGTVHEATFGLDVVRRRGRFALRCQAGVGVIGSPQRKPASGQKRLSFARSGTPAPHVGGVSAPPLAWFLANTFHVFIGPAIEGPLITSPATPERRTIAGRARLRGTVFELLGSRHRRRLCRCRREVTWCSRGGIEGLEDRRCHHRFRVRRLRRCCTFNVGRRRRGRKRWLKRWRCRGS